MPAFSREERQLLSDSVEDYLADRHPAGHAVGPSRPEGNGVGRGWADYARLGWLGLALPEAVGGSGGLTEAAIVLAAAGKVLAQEPLIPTLILGAGAIARVGTEGQRSLLADVVAGERVLAFCHTEPDAGYDRSHVNALAGHDGDGYSISGDKAFAIGAHAADTLVVSARIGDGAGPVGLFLLPADAAGLERITAPCLDGRLGAAVRMRDVPAGGDALLGGVPVDRLGEIDRLLDRGTLAVCAEAVGAMSAAAAITTQYIKSREQFGRPLAEFQVLQHRVVDMHLMGEECRAMVHAVLEATDRAADDDAGTAVAIWRAKVKVAQASRFVGGQGIQLHGGMGMTDDMAIGHYYKRLAVCEAMFGDADWHLDRLAAAEGASTGARRELEVA
ncbi:acyl-CoA dehydrogenase family protein [Acuticoccus sp.]|uniref:acyl-CoA dehydrogenase family protein n=1 Tax=Acuticoccus sp. TaxID=1904378 RepID=UPI003B52AE35